MKEHVRRLRHDGALEVVGEDRYFVKPKREAKPGQPRWIVADRNEHDRMAAGPFRTENAARINAMAMNDLGRAHGHRSENVKGEKDG